MCSEVWDWYVSWSWRTATWPLRRTVSRGRRTKSSAVEEKNVAKEYVVGVRRGSTLRVDLRTSGVDVEIKVGTQALRRVDARRRGETVHEGRRERQG